MDDRESIELREFEAEATIERDMSADHPTASKLELWSWYIYDFASQPFSSAAVSFLIPLILEDLAWRAGTSNILDPKYPPCVDRSTLPPNSAPPPCFVKFGLIWTTPVAFALYVTSISVGLQVFSFLTFGVFADYSRWRKLFLTIFSVFNIVLCLLFLTVISPKLYPLAATLAILANVAYGTAMVFYNAYLPLLVEAHPTVRKFKYGAELELHSARTSFGSFENVSTFEQSKEEVASKLSEVTDKVTNQVSTNGLAFGFVGGVLSLLMLYGILYAFGDQTYNMQICVAITGIWLLIGLLAFTVPFLKTRPGPPLPKDEKSFVLFSWKKFGKTFAKAKKLKNLFLFLISWFFYSDGYSTIGHSAILFGKAELGMTNIQVMIISVEAPLAAAIGNFFFLWLLKHQLKLSTKVSTLIMLVLVALIPLWGILGFAFPPSWPIGIKSIPEMYVLGAYYGFILGALQSFSRSLFAELVPPGMESEFFSLFEITDRGSSWLGPLLVGVMAQSFGTRFGFIAIIVILLISFPWLIMVNMQKGRLEAKEFKV